MTLLIGKQIMQPMVLDSLSERLTSDGDEVVFPATAEDVEDLASFDERAHEPVLDFEEVLNHLKARGRL